MKQRNSIYAVGADGQDEQERQSESLVPPNKKDLPVFLRTVVTVSAKVVYKQSMVLLYLVSQVQGFFVWYQITQSFVSGATLAFLFGLSGAADVYFQPDFSRGFFLSILLSDLSHTKKLDKTVKNGIIGNVVVTSIMTFLFTYFFVVPFQSVSCNNALLGILDARGAFPAESCLGRNET